MGYAGYGNHSEPPQLPDGLQERIPQEKAVGNNRPPGGTAPAATPHEPGSGDPFREVEA